MRKTGLLMCTSALLCAAGCSTIHVRDIWPDPVATSFYERLLAMYPEDAQGLGSDNHFETSEHQPMTYGLILSSESFRARATQLEEPRRRLKKAMRWLIENQDLDGDGHPGWGLPQAWDAFQDGSTNPENHPYTITTAIVLNGMLDALNVEGLWSAPERDTIRRLAARTVVYWCRAVWSEGYGGGYFWYSPSKADAHFAVNTPAMFMGTMCRLARRHADLFSEEERALVWSRADDLARAMVATVDLREGAPFWAYMALPNFRNSARPNDLVHHVYTVWGIETYRTCGGTVSLPWTRAGAVESVRRFWKGDRICEFPQDVVYTGAEAAFTDRPAILWGAGMMLAGFARAGEHAEAVRALAAIERDYGPLPNLTLRPSPTTTRDASFYPRQAAHVLWGLALYAFSPP